MFYFVSFQLLKKIAKFIQEQNGKIYAARGLLLIDPIERGLRGISFYTKQFYRHQNSGRK
uniref:Uncharacterized protein n=1 Tax=Oncorhynchus tshawytscha TaxID=74940 RepID=A0A8C8IYY7_ONCTS